MPITGGRPEWERSHQRKWQDFHWYHCIDLGHGIITDGDYDMAPYLQLYGFPADLRGNRVLDVGRASGFFSFEFERRGADVTATDIASVLDWDFVGGEAERARRKQSIGDIDAHNRRYVSGAFHYAHEMRGSRVKAKSISAYDLHPSAFNNNRFDLVFAGSITSHLRDPILALERLRAVTSNLCIIAAPSIGVLPDIPMMALVGTADSDRLSWWVINKKGLVEMLYCAGFSSAEIVSEFWLTHRKSGQKYHHIVAHARP